MMSMSTDAAAPVLRRGLLWLAVLTTLGVLVELAAERHWTQPIQFVAWGGAIWFGRFAQRRGAYLALRRGTVAWIVIVCLAVFLPRHDIVAFLGLGVAIAIVMGGTQALSRSFFSFFIPHGREGEYFALYNACERGTSWFGTLLFGVVFQVTGSYRPAILALIVFFVLGLFFLFRLDPARGIRDAGNALPRSL